MMRQSNYTRRRRVIQFLSVMSLISIPLRWTCIDLDRECLRFFGLEFGLETMFYPLFAIVGLLLVVIYLSMKKGRIFCSHLCPMHMYLETVNRPSLRNAPARSAAVWIWSLC